MTLRTIQTLTCLIAAVSISPSTASAQGFFSKRELFDESTGVMQSSVGGESYRGSAVVARDPRLIYSCGHVFFDDGQWATEYSFTRYWHSNQPPNFYLGAIPRGFRFFTEYSFASREFSATGGRKGFNSARAFSYDFTVFYGPDSFGPAIYALPDGAAALASGNRKRIVGYPATVRANGASGGYFQHATDWFNIRAQQDLGNYWGFDGVTTGGGNSGGPVFVYDDSNTFYSLAGILISGGATSAGVYAINPSSETLATEAIGNEPNSTATTTTTQIFTNETPTPLPDGGKSYVTRPIEVTDALATVSNLKLGLAITARRRGDLDVFLRSPAGRIRIIAKPSKRKDSDLLLNGLDYSSTFRSSAANGIWQLKMRDAVKKNRSTFSRCDLEITASGP